MFAFDYKVAADSDPGWNDGSFAIGFMNSSGKMLDAVTGYGIQIDTISVDTREGKTYPGQVNNDRIETDFLDVNESAVLPILPNIPVHNQRSNYTYSGTYGSEAVYVVSFRFAQAAHPTQIHLHFTPTGIVVTNGPDLTLDLSSIPSSPPAYQPDNPRPISELGKALSGEKAGKYKLQFGDKCTVSYNEPNTKRGWHMEMPYTVTNLDQLDQTTEGRGIDYALWFPYGAVQWVANGVRIDLGPGQSQDGSMTIAEWEALDEPMPKYLFLYEPSDGSGNYTSFVTYLLDCADKQ